MPDGPFIVLSFCCSLLDASSNEEATDVLISGGFQQTK